LYNNILLGIGVLDDKWSDYNDKYIQIENDIAA